MNAIFQRRSVRQFQNTPVTTQQVETLLRAAMCAPSAGNQQPWEFYVVQDRETQARLSQCSPYAGCAAKAPLVLVPCAKKEGVGYPENVPMDLSAATENILLEAVALGLGAVWLGIAPLEARIAGVRKVLNIPETLEPFALVAVGTPEKNIPAEDRYQPEKVHHWNHLST